MSEGKESGVSEKLKPKACMKCGRRTIVHQGQGPSQRRGFWVRCGCGIGPFRTDRAEAIRLWNARKQKEPKK